MMLDDTRERALPLHQGQSQEDYLVHLKHVALYNFAKTRCAAKRVLDLGCGEGYGSRLLSDDARFVIAADYSFEAVAHARNKYAGANIAFTVCDAQALPFRDAAFDCAISFEVIEHIPNVRRYLHEIKRVLGKAGAVIISTPNRLLRLLPFQKPWNRFHLREYDARGLARAIGQVFSRVQMRGITAIPEILQIEKQRVKQNPFIAYPRMIAQMILPRALYDRLRGAKDRPAANRAEAPATAYREIFSADDFSISEKKSGRLYQSHRHKRVF